jgi:hypothetical protein
MMKEFLVEGARSLMEQPGSHNCQSQKRRPARRHGGYERYE